MFLLFLITTFTKKSSKKQHLADNKQESGEVKGKDMVQKDESNGINCILLSNDGSESRADVYFSNKIHPDEVQLMRGNPGADENSFFVCRDLLDSTEYNANQKSISVPLPRANEAGGHLYSIKIVDGDNTYHTEPFIWDNDTKQFVLEREYNSRSKVGWSGFTITLIALAGVALLLFMIFLLAFLCRG
ncbi:hypothetical protein DMUE_0352 [Dictyocoela muelleri]|nr:hypothetical protein DMUE_0352 [Dictyocoela muelleri]